MSGTAVDQVEATSAALERDLSQHSATGGDTVRFVLTEIISSILLMSLGIGGTYCSRNTNGAILKRPSFLSQTGGFLYAAA